MFYRILFIAILLQTTAAHAQIVGDIEYRAGLGNYIFFNGTEWRKYKTTPTLSSCTKEAELDFNPALAIYKLCDGTRWKTVSGTITLSPCSKKGARDYFNNSYHYCTGLVWANMDGGSALGGLAVAAGDE